MKITHLAAFFVVVGCGPICGSVFGCSNSSSDRMQDRPDIVGRMPRPVCEPAAGGGSVHTTQPELIAVLSDRWHEGWQGSPAVADVNGDGQNEIIVTRANRVYAWRLDGTIAFYHEVEGGRIWAPPIVANLDPDRPGMEIAVAARGKLYVWGSDGELLFGFPVTWRDELRSLAAGDITGDGRPELVVVTTNGIRENEQFDIIMAYDLQGQPIPGFPPNTTGASGCDSACYVFGGFDQNIALGDVTGDGRLEIFATQDNAYLSLHDYTGFAFDAATEFRNRTKFLGVRFLHDYDLARQGWANDEQTANQAHFTNSSPAIADITGDGHGELIVLASVQNAAQTDRKRGVALWVVRPDGSRPEHWHEPFHAPDYLAGLWDFSGTNVVAQTNQVTVADIDPDEPGPELLFAGFDGRIYAISSRAELLWRHTYTKDSRVLTGGLLAADLSGDGVPEIVFASYSPDPGKSNLFILSAAGERLHTIPLPGRGAMPVPTIADVSGDGVLEIVVSLKDGKDREPQVKIYSIPGSAANCLLWPTGRGNYLRNGFIRPFE